MSKKKIAIIGGGFTGLYSAFIASDAGYQVELYETSKYPGGISKDLLSKDNKRFIRGCHYLLKNSPLMNNIKKSFIDKCFIEEDLKYMSYCDLFNNKNNILKDYPDLFFDNKITLKVKKLEKKNLKSRIDNYPKAISKPLFRWVSRFNINCSDMVQDSNRNGLMFSRVCITTEKNIQNLKKKNKNIDDLYGLNKNKNFSNFRTLLPKNGYDDFFREYVDILKKKNVKLFFNSPIKSFWKNNKNLEIKLFNNKITCDHILWTGNPTPLIKNFNNIKLDSVYTNLRMLTFYTKGSFKQSFYIQVFSKKTSILRLFFYKSSNDTCCTVECFNENQSIKQIIADINQILKKSGINIQILSNQAFNDICQKRYSLLTNRDQKILYQFKRNTRNSNLLAGPWEIYSREKKFESLKKIINNI